MSQSIIDGLLNAPPVPPKTFELALVMGGTVSAGAYTAGAADFLVEALDGFAAEKQKSGRPYHDLILKVLAGTSGGAVVSAILARALKFDFPSMSYGAGSSTVTNPLYDIWVKQLDLMPMLDPSDIQGNNVPSLLNAKVLDQAAAYIENYAGATRPSPRAWVGGPLKIILTHTNLSGFPVEIGFGNGQTQRFVDHADNTQFAVTYDPAKPYATPAPYEFTLVFDNAKLPQAASWQDFGAFALASAAFPLGFPTRRLERPRAQYQYRLIATGSDPAEGPQYKILQPDWTAMLNNNAAPTLGNFRYSSVDGGVANNEPIELARTALAGLLGHNPRDTNLANRAVWLIDPFAGQAAMGAFAIAGPMATAIATLNALLQQGRYGTADLVLAADPDVYSRYMLQASRDNLTGGDALATGGLSAFLGFTCEAFRRFDYHLGRKNCQDFLLHQFRQTATNKVFDGWDANDRKPFLDDQGDLPLLPLFGAAAVPESLPPWPAGALNPAIFKDGIETRYKALLGAVLPQSFWGKCLGLLGGFLTEDKAAAFVIDQITEALTAAKLD